MAYSGSCHCGAVAFTVDAEIPTGAMSCNCSHCQRKGFLLTFVPAGQFTLDSGEDQLETYTFNKHAIRHRFCRTCGVQAFGEGEREGMALRAVNLRCVPEVDINALEIQKVDGARF
jgi:hypothetical protein